PDLLRSYVAGLSCRIDLSHPAGAGGDVLKDYPADAPCVEVGPEDAVYVAFTSGSTGKPKGIVGKHGGLAHFAQWAERTFGVSESDRFTALSGLSHDPLHRDVFTPLQLGGSVCLPSSADMATPERLAQWVR